MQQQSIVLKNRQTLKRIELNNLYAIVGDGYCSTFLLCNNDKFTCSKTLKEVEQILPPPVNYLRINKNTIINMQKISELSFDKRVVSLENGLEFQVSVRKMKEMVKSLETINGKL